MATMNGYSNTYSQKVLVTLFYTASARDEVVKLIDLCKLSVYEKRQGQPNPFKVEFLPHPWVYYHQISDFSSTLASVQVAQI